MAEPYNLTLVTGKTNILGVVQGANDLSGGWFGIFILFAFFIITVMAFKNSDIKNRIMAASYSTSGVAVLLRLMSLIDDTWLFGTFILSALFYLLSLWL